MSDFQKIKEICDKNSVVSESFVDNFLIYFISAKEKLEEKLFRQLASFKKIILKMPKEWPGWLMSQLIAHRIFRENGLAEQYQNHAGIKSRSPEEIEYFQLQIECPWRFSFCSIQKNPFDAFYEMKDVLSDESFLLYSPGIERTVNDLGYTPNLWFFLIGFNGECYQTFGNLCYFKGIQPFDLFYFAKQLNAGINFQSEVEEMIESNPVPFTMLWSGAELPVTYHKKDMLVFNKSEFHIEDFNPEKYGSDFLIEKKHPIYMLSLKRWHTFPHFAKCFYHTKKNLFTITSMTARGYSSLISALNKYGNEFPSNPEVMATPAMIHLTDEILNINIEMNPYEKHFLKKPSPESQKHIDKINAFLKLLVNRLNKNEDYDIAELAEKSGIDIENAERIAESVIKKLSDKFWKGGINEQ